MNNDLRRVQTRKLHMVYVPSRYSPLQCYISLLVLEIRFTVPFNSAL